MHEADDIDVGGPNDRMLTWREVQAVAGISRTTVWRLQQRDAFPKPVTLSPGRVCWWETEVMAWRRSRSAAGFRSLDRPRLPGMPRRSRPAPPAPKAAEPTVEPPAPKCRSKVSVGRRRAVSPNQIDFGF